MHLKHYPETRTQDTRKIRNSCFRGRTRSLVWAMPTQFSCTKESPSFPPPSFTFLTKESCLSMSLELSGGPSFGCHRAFWGNSKHGPSIWACLCPSTASTGPGQWPVLALSSGKRKGCLCWFWFLHGCVFSCCNWPLPFLGQRQVLALGEHGKTERRREKYMRSQPGWGQGLCLDFPELHLLSGSRGSFPSRYESCTAVTAVWGYLTRLVYLSMKM